MTSHWYYSQDKTKSLSSVSSRIFITIA